MKLKLPAAFAMLTLTLTAQADVQLSKQDLLGSWQIDKESVHRDGSDARAMNTVWKFREDGVMEGVSQESDSHKRVDQMRAELYYSVEDGKLHKQAAAGRSKYDICAAIEKEGGKMVLKCGMNYFFMTKK
jgi:hypothetical protein